MTQRDNPARDLEIIICLAACDGSDCTITAFTDFEMCFNAQDHEPANVLLEKMMKTDDEQLTPGTLYEWHEVEYGDERTEIIFCVSVMLHVAHVMRVSLSDSRLSYTCNGAALADGKITDVDR